MNRPWIICAAIAVFSLSLNAHGDVNLEDIKGKEWPGHNPDFSGPGDPDKLAAAALDFLRKKPDWSRPEYDDVHMLATMRRNDPYGFFSYHYAYFTPAILYFLLRNF